MCLLLQENRSDHLKLSYYAISSHLNQQNSRKPVLRAFLRIMTPLLRELMRFQGRNNFSTTITCQRSCLSIIVCKISKNDSSNLKKMTKNLFCGQNLAYFGPYLAEILFSTTKTTITCQTSCLSIIICKISKNYNDAISRKWPKTSFWAQF